MHIDDILKNRMIDISSESKKIFTLLEEKENYLCASSYSYSLFDVVEYCFRELPISGNCISCDEFISETDFGAYDINTFSILIEKVLSLLFQCRAYADRTTKFYISTLDRKIKQITKVIRFDLEKLSLRTETQNKTDFGPLVYVIRNDVLIDKAIETAPKLVEAIIDYSRPSNNGNLVEKEKNLHFIIKEVEHIAQDKTFKYKDVAEQAECIFNMFHIRHDNIKGKMKNSILSTMSDKELEDVFDMGFRLCLELLILDEFRDIDQKVSNLRKRMKQD